jgi:hypothetical protein
MPVAHGIPQMPPEVVIAKQRLMRAMETIVSSPSLNLSVKDTREFRDGAEKVFADPSKWDAIAKLQRDAESTVRGFVMGLRPTEAEMEQAATILKDFTYKALVSIGAYNKFASGAAAGYVKSQLLNDPAKRAAIGPLYMRLRLILMGISA